MRVAKFLLTLMLFVFGPFSRGQDIKPVSPVIQGHPVLSARGQAAAPAALPGGRPPKLDDTPYSGSASVSWRTSRPFAELKIQGAGPFPKKGTVEVFKSPPGFITSIPGAAYTLANQIQVKPIVPIYTAPVITADDGTFALNVGMFAPKPKSTRPIISRPGAIGDGGSRGSVSDPTAVGMIDNIGFTTYYVRFVDSAGNSTTTVTVEYGEKMPPEMPSFVEARREGNGPPWTNNLTTSSSAIGFRWTSQASDVTSAVYQISQNNFGGDPRSWRVVALSTATGAVPFPAINGEFGLDVSNQVVGGTHPKGDYFLRVILLKINGDLAAQPSDPMKIHFVEPPVVQLPPSSFETDANMFSGGHGEFAEKSVWSKAAKIELSRPVQFRWNADTSAKQALVVLRQVDDGSNKEIQTKIVGDQGRFEWDLAGTISYPHVYVAMIYPNDGHGNQVSQQSGVIITLYAPNTSPPQTLPPGSPVASAYFGIELAHYAPPWAGPLYHFVLTKDPPNNNPVEQAYYSWYKQLAGGATPHKGLKVYLPPKQDNGKSWTDVIADAPSFLASVFNFAENLISFANGFVDSVKNFAAEQISNATGIPVELVRLGIDVACTMMGVPENPIQLPGLGELGSDFVAGQILDASGAGDLARDQLSSAIQSGAKDMAKAGHLSNNTLGPDLVPDPDFADKPAMMQVKVTCKCSEEGVYVGTSPIFVQVEGWYDEGAGQDHVVLFEANVNVPKMKNGQTLMIPFALRYSKMHSTEPGRWNKAFNLSKKTLFTVDYNKYNNKPLRVAWP